MAFLQYPNPNPERKSYRLLEPLPCNLMSEQGLIFHQLRNSVCNSINELQTWRPGLSVDILKRSS